MYFLSIINHLLFFIKKKKEANHILIYCSINGVKIGSSFLVLVHLEREREDQVFHGEEH